MAPDRLDEDLANELLAKGLTVATAESCTAGLVAARLADRPGSSAYLVGGFVTYSNAAKISQLGVDADVLAEHGAVSEPVALAMARGARHRLETSFGISTTGVAGPGGGTPEKPVGLVHVAVSGPGGDAHLRLMLPGDRRRVRSDTVTELLRLLLDQARALP
ncbi:nicotinamide-nucleotide amidase [Nocardioides daedukensis]|uniref:Nicotinamide-nucleotide amidase n=1 Tax=Nocardioides daedukensis TaxID=634462 RepID=A0A7Y9UVK1_9ACTN|nr:nicotinamide-nucleotide amidohydrolase family protein [Nocardioides daedukensis]NYG57615.1 nicotinamide-nucleotide amidase [Nocardioides daedukensis]